MSPPGALAKLGRPARGDGPKGAPILVTGGAGFIGSNLVDRLAEEGNEVIVYDALTRPGVEGNLDWLKRRHPQRVAAVIADIRDRASLAEAAREARAVFHFAAQVAVTTSMAEPCDDFEVNLRSTLTLLDILRRRGAPVPLIFASTNKVYGDLADIDLGAEGDAYLPRDPALRAHGIDERRALSFHTPYGCSKGGADQYVLDFAHSFGLPTAVLRMSCIYGERQLGTEDQGWVAHFLRRALAGLPITLFGDGRQVRDLLHVDDAIAAYLGAWRRIAKVAGCAFNLGGGPENAVSLRQVIAEIEAMLGRRIELRFADWRPGDQRYFVADARRARAALGLKPPLGWRAGLARLAAWLRSEIGESGEGAPAAPPRAAATARVAP
jgi:CDP-paratose 2-epimerase